MCVKELHLHDDVMQKAQNHQNLLFIDIETVSQQRRYSQLSSEWQGLWTKKATRLHRYEHGSSDITSADIASLYEDKAAIYAEYGKVICISIGRISTDDDVPQLRIKSYYGHDEYELLDSFAMMMSRHFSSGQTRICGHNIREFDLPYLCRRMLAHGIPIPSVINVQGKKPWEVKHIVDTLELWKYGDYKSYISLDCLCAVLSIDSPKGGIDGSQVGHHYYKLEDIDSIVAYCEMDVLATACVHERMHYRALPILHQSTAPNLRVA